MIFGVNQSLWSKVGHYSKSLSKGPNTTTWIWNLHSDAHDFDIHSGNRFVKSRKVFASNLAHLSLVFFWLGGMHFHGAYLSNYCSWLKDPIHSVPSAQLVWSLVGQDALMGDVGGYFQGIEITSGLFQLWRSEGIVSSYQLKVVCLFSLLASIICLIGAYFHMHVSWPATHFYRKLKSLSSHHILILFGLGSVSWSAHQFHVAVPINRMLDSGVDPSLVSSSVVGSATLSLFGSSLDSMLPCGSMLSVFETSLNPVTGGLFLTQVATHHLFVGVVSILGGFIRLYVPSSSSNLGFRFIPRVDSWHAQLSINLAVTGSLSITFGHHIYAMPVYPYLGSDYSGVLCLFCHHIWLGGFFIAGCGAHAAIFVIRDYHPKTLNNGGSFHSNALFLALLNQRDVLIGHLIYVSLFLGLHSFGLYLHNDTLQALGRPEDMFGDNSLQLKPIFSNLNPIVSFEIETLAGKVVRMGPSLGTADFMVHHIHAFTIHTTLLVLLKGVCYARSSRLVADKLELGFRFPCDGPGRGGTCQISSWDHVYLALFWVYNSISVVLFHFFWKMQSDVWGLDDKSYSSIVHISGGDFSSNSGTINGWLRTFLWSQSAQVIQSYGTSVSGYGLIFLGGHFVWAFSLMFLYSGRGYWQELIESIVWSHHKLGLVPSIQPRALSISQGRAVGLTHFILGGIACSWSFFISRMVVLGNL